MRPESAIVSLLIIITLLAASYSSCPVGPTGRMGQEGFEVIYTNPPEWYRKQAYNRNDWYTAYFPDQLEKPECMHTRGDPAELNLLSSAYIHWRM